MAQKVKLYFYFIYLLKKKKRWLELVKYGYQWFFQKIESEY